MANSLPFQTRAASDDAAELTFASCTQVREVRPGHWPDIYTPADCILPHLRQWYAIEEKLEYPGYVAGDGPTIDRIRYDNAARGRREAALRWTAMMGMPYRFNAANGRMVLQPEGPVRPQVDGPVMPAPTTPVPFSPASRDFVVREPQETLHAGAGAVGTGFSSLSQPLTFRSAPAVQAAARTRSPVRREKRSRSASPSPSLPFISSSEQVTAHSLSSSRSSSSTTMPSPDPPRQGTDCLYPSPENVARMSSFAAGHRPGAHDFGITLPRAAEPVRAPVSQAPQAGSTQDATPQRDPERVARRQGSQLERPPVPLYPWGAE